MCKLRLERRVYQRCKTEKREELAETACEGLTDNVVIPSKGVCVAGVE